MSQSPETAEGAEGGFIGFAEVAAATESFGLLADETRLRILLALAENASLEGFENMDGLSFAALRSAVGVEDPGRFNYHLGKLRETFVRKDGDEYLLTYAGYRVTTDVASGVYHDEAPATTVETSIPCLQPDCDRSLRVEYEAGYVRLTCPDPDHETTQQTSLPPNAVRDREAREVLDVGTRDLRQVLTQVRAGTCPFCWGRVDLTVPDQLEPEHLPPDADPEEAPPMAGSACRDCMFETRTPVSVFATQHPAVRAAQDDWADPRSEKTLIEYPFTRRPAATTVRSEDPARVAVDTDPDGEYGTPVIVFGPSLEVVATEYE